MGRGLSELQKAALTAAVVFDPEHKKSKWQRGLITKEVALKRTQGKEEFFGRPVKPVEPDPEHVTEYHLVPCELVDHYYCQQVYPSNAQQVAVSKALARLVKRGLMIKLDKRGTLYGDQYNLTEDGLQMAVKLLTNG